MVWSFELGPNVKHTNCLLVPKRSCRRTSRQHSNVMMTDFMPTLTTIARFFTAVTLPINQEERRRSNSTRSSVERRLCLTNRRWHANTTMTPFRVRPRPCSSTSTSESGLMDRSSPMQTSSEPKRLVQITELSGLTESTHHMQLHSNGQIKFVRTFSQHNSVD